MDLKSIVPDGDSLISMAPEELALAVLRILNESDDRYRGRGTLETIGFTNFCGAQAQRYPDKPEHVCALAIASAFQHLVTAGLLVPSPLQPHYGWFHLTDRAKSVKDPADYQRFRHAGSYPRGTIHPAIENNTYSEFMKGDYDTALFKAFKTLEDTVRRRAGFDNGRVGVNMMRDAFHPDRDNAPLTDKSEEGGEREALMHLMSGALGRFKNPTGHRFTGLDDPIVTIEILQLASLLMRIAEQRPATSPPAGGAVGQS